LLTAWPTAARRAMPTCLCYRTTPRGSKNSISRDRYVGAAGEGRDTGHLCPSRRVSDAVCSVCEVPLEHALAEGFGTSHKLPDLQTIRDWRQSHIDEIANEERRRKEINDSVTSTLQALMPTGVARDAQRARVREPQRFRDACSGPWFKARRVINDVKRLDGM